MKSWFKNNFLGLLTILTLFVVGCEKENYRENIPEPYNGNIYSYDIGEGQVGSANITNTYVQNRVAIVVEFGTDLSNITPTIEISPGAKISPASGTAVDFSQNGQVTYTVTAPSGDVYEWLVVITEQEDPNTTPDGTDGTEQDGTDTDGNGTDETDTDGTDNDGNGIYTDGNNTNSSN